MEEHRKPEQERLEREVQMWMSKGYVIASRQPKAIQLVRQNKKSCLIAGILFCFGVLPGIVYVMWPEGEKVVNVYIDQGGMIRVNGRLTSAEKRRTRWMWLRSWYWSSCLRKRKGEMSKFSLGQLVILAMLAIGVLSIAVIGIGMVMATVQGTVAPEPVHADVPVAVNTLPPAWTPTPEPIATVAPVIVTCEDINGAKDSLTDLQFEAYQKELLGKYLVVDGTVSEVIDNGDVVVKDCLTEWAFALYIEDMPEDLALTLNKDQRIQGTFLITYSDTFIFEILKVKWSE